MATLVYEYGLLQPTENGDRVRDQIRLAHRYQNALIEIERDRRTAVRAALAETDDVGPKVARLESLNAELDAVRESIRAARQESRSRATQSESSDRAKSIIAEIKAVRAEVKAAKLAVRDNPAIRARLAEIDAAAHDREIATRAEFSDRRGLYWGTYLLTETAVQAAKRGKMDPKFQPWTGDGMVGVQIQSTKPLADIFGDDTRIRIDPVSAEAWDTSVPRGQRKRLQRTTVHLRIGSEPGKRSPVWASWPMLMHRPLPEGARVTWAKVVMRRRSPHPGHNGRAPWCRWWLQLTIDVPSVAERAVEAPKVAAIDLGWRKRPAGLRVAYVVGSDGKREEVNLPKSIDSRLDKAASIRGFRDDGIDVVKAKIGHKLRDRIPLTDELRERIAHLDAWRSPEKLVHLLHALSALDVGGMSLTERDAIDEVLADLEAWRRRDLHLGQYEAGLRRGALAHRREVYRHFAAKLCDAYDVIALEDFDLRSTATKANDEDAETSTSGHREQQRRAAPYMLRQAIMQAAARRGVRVVMVSSVDTTRTCQACGGVCAGDMAEAIDYRCEHCGALWDQDENAGREILARGQAMLADREALAATEKKPRTARFAKRHKAKTVETEAPKEAA